MQIKKSKDNWVVQISRVQARQDWNFGKGQTKESIGEEVSGQSPKGSKIEKI